MQGETVRWVISADIPMKIGDWELRRGIFIRGGYSGVAIVIDTVGERVTNAKTKALQLKAATTDCRVWLT